MADLTLAPEDEKEIHDILVGYREAGVERPLLPADVDMDGDGIVDAFGLDADDNVIVVSGVDLGVTVYDTAEEGVGIVDLSGYEVE